MRLVAQFVLGGLILGGSPQLSAAESGASWWPFGADDKSATVATTTPLQQEAAGQTAPVQQTAAHDPFAAQQAQQTTTVYPRVAQAPPAKDPPKSVTVDRGWSWPAIHLPEFASLQPPRMPQKNWGSDPEIEISRNTWYEEPQQPAERSPWQAVKGSAQRVRQGTRNAWDKTVDVFSPGDDANGRLSRREETKPPLWKRMFGMEEEKPQGPRTVTEWMAQERLDP
jgi:hypothetical protein